MIFLSAHSRKLISSLVLASGVIAMAGCGGVKDPNDPAFVVAKGKGVVITRSDLESAKKEYLTQSGVDIAQVPKEVIASLDQQVLDQKVTQALLLKEGEKIQIPDMDKQIDQRLQQLKSQFKDQAEFENRLKQVGFSEEKIRKDIRDQIIINEVFKKNIAEPQEPTKDEIEKFYKENPKSFAQPKLVKASHVLVKVEQNATSQEKAEKKKKIEKARARVVKGEDFGKVAKEVSDDPGSASRGGSLGEFFPEGRMVPEFDKMAFNSKVKEISPVFETTYGFHFLRVDEIKQPREVPLAEASPMIAKYLKDKQRKVVAENYLAKLKADADIKYFTTPPAKADDKKDMRKNVS